MDSDLQNRKQQVYVVGNVCIVDHFFTADIFTAHSSEKYWFNEWHIGAALSEITTSLPES